MSMTDVRNTIKRLYAYIFAIALIVNAQALFLNTDATDSIRAYGGTQAQMTSGRFIGHYLDVISEQMGFFFPYRYINVLLFIAFTAMAVIFILVIFGIKSTLKGCLIGGIIASSAASSGVLVYFYVVHMYGLCFLISMMSAYLILKKKMTVIPVLLIVLSLGIYQAYFATLILVIFIYQFAALATCETDIKAWLLDVARCVFIAAAALIIYILANKLALHLAGLDMTGYANMSENVVPSYGITQLANLLISSYTLIGSFIFTDRYFFCDNIVMRICIAVSFIGFLWLYASIFIRQKSTAKRCLLIVLLLLLPCIINLPMFISTEVPERVCLNWYFIFIIPLVLANAVWTDTCENDNYENDKYGNDNYENDNYGNAAIAKVTAVFGRYMMPLVLCACLSASLYSAYRNVNIYTSYAKANALAEDIVDDIEHRIASSGDYSTDKELCFVGALDTELTNGSFFNIEYSEFLYKLFNRDYSSVFKRYALLDYKYLTPDDERVSKYHASDIVNINAVNEEDDFYCIEGIHVGHPTIHSNIEAINKMPSYPDSGCVKEVNGIIIVKLSD